MPLNLPNLGLAPSAGASTSPVPLEEIERRLRERLLLSGQEIPQQSPGLLMRIFHAMALPQRYLVTKPLKAVTGASGENLYEVAKNILRAAGVSDQPLFDAKVPLIGWRIRPSPAGMLAQAADILLDPLNLVSFGLAGGTAKAAEEGAKAARAALAAGKTAEEARAAAEAAARPLLEAEAQRVARGQIRPVVMRLGLPGGQVELQPSRLLPRPVRQGVEAAARAVVHFRPYQELGRRFVPGFIPDHLANQTVEVRDLPARLADLITTEIWGLVGGLTGKEIRGSLTPEDLAQKLSGRLSASEAYKALTGQHRELETRTNAAIQHVSRWIGDTLGRLSYEERLKISRAVAHGTVDQLPPHLQQAAMSFTRGLSAFRNMMLGAGIPVGEIERYVPLIAVRTPKAEELQMIPAEFRRQVEELLAEAERRGGMDEELWQRIARIAPQIIPRKMKGGLAPQDINELLKTPLFLEDAAAILSTYATRAIRATHYKRFTDAIVSAFGIPIADAMKIAEDPMRAKYGLYRVGHTKGGWTFFEPLDAAQVVAQTRKQLGRVEKRLSAVDAVAESLAGAEARWREYAQRFASRAAGQRKTIEQLLENTAEALKGRDLVRARALTKRLDKIIAALPERMEKASAKAVPLEALAARGQKLEQATEKHLKRVQRLIQEARRQLEPFLARAENIVALPEEFVQHLNAVARAAEEPSAFLQFYDRAMRGWRTLATVIWPRYWIRNKRDDFWQMYLAGANPAKAFQAASMIRRYFRDELSDAEKVIWQDAERLGVIDVGTFAGYLDRPIGAIRPSPRAIVRAGQKAFDALMRAGRVTTDWHSRLMLFLDRLEKGFTPAAAAAEVKKYLFDWHELTPFERQYMKRLIPFYSWVRKNIPLQIVSMIEKPAKFARVGRWIERQQEEGDMPSWLREMAGFPAPGGEQYVAADLPYVDLSRLDAHDLLNMLTPFARFPIEAGTGRSVFTGRPIAEPGDPRWQALLRLMATEFIPPFPQTKGLFEPARSREAAKRLAFGIQQYPAPWVEEKARQERIRRMQDFIAWLQRQGIDVPTWTELGRP